MRAPPTAKAAGMNVVPNTLIGQEIERTEDLRFLTGTGTFVDDYEPAGTLHAAILRSSVAHGRIVGLNKDAALRMPGVHAVLDAVGCRRRRFRPFRCGWRRCRASTTYLQPVIAHGKVRYVGEPVAIVLADSRAIAEDALDVIDLTIEPLDGGSRLDRCARPTRSVLFEQNGTNVAIRYKANIGDVGRAVHKPPITPARKASAPIATPRCRWKRAALSPNGMPRSRTPEGQRRDQGQFLQPRAHSRRCSICRKARST